MSLQRSFRIGSFLTILSNSISIPAQGQEGQVVVQVLARGRIEHHQIASMILADAGSTKNRELTIYVPEGYDTSGLNYPVVYLIHGASDNNRFFVSGGSANAPVIAGNLVESKQMEPLILVFPNMGRGENSRSLVHENYLTQEVVPFVDKNYRTISTRNARAVAGYSRGGADAFYTALAHPEFFSIVGTYSSGFYRTVPSEDLLTNHNQSAFPLLFWIYVGTNDENNNVLLNRPLVEMLERLALQRYEVG